jgi:hypothetical protein
MFIALALIALGFGYKTFLEATDVKNDRRRAFGRIVGIYIMCVAFAMSVGHIAKMVDCGPAAGKCPLMSKLCPVKK